MKLRKSKKVQSDMVPAAYTVDEKAKIAPDNEKNRKSSVRRAVGAAVLVVSGVLAGSIYANNPPTDVLREDASGSEEAKRIENTLKAKIESGEATVENSIVVLGKGAIFRAEPARITGSDENVTREENQVFIVGDGESVVIDRPVVITDEDGERWAGVNLKVGQVNTEDGTEPNTTFAWVNLTAIERDSQETENPESLYKELSYSLTDVNQMGTEYQSVTEAGTLNGFINPASGTELSSAFIMPSSDAVEFAQSQVA
jgi:hypothetical protein